ncbi:MAG TPA: hypothetical protein PKJ63_01390 [Cyclobacteriaceae bacterium]|nr:hypothetical protein [Cyclobacteriaceae bacterium]
MTIQLKGEQESGRVWLFEQELFPEESQKIRNHSPDGFAWGYNGSGPAQLALALCIELFGKEYGLQIYQDFKFWYIGSLPQGDFELDIQIQPELFNKYPFLKSNTQSA